MTVTHPQGFLASGVGGRAQVHRQERCRARGERGPVVRCRRRFHLQPRRSPPRSRGAAKWSRMAASTPSILNSGGANACTGPEGFADTHAHRRARRFGAAGRGPGRLRGRRRRVLDRASSACGCPWTRCSRGVDAAVGELAPDGGDAAAARDHDHRLRAEDRHRGGRRLVDRRDGQGRGNARTRHGDHAVRRHHRRPHRPRAGRSSPSRRPCAPRSTASTPTAACPPTTPCC